MTVDQKLTVTIILISGAKERESGHILTYIVN
jgi:hypothetical protein